MADRSVKVVVSAAVQGFVSGMRTAQGSVTDFTRRASAGFERNQQHLDTLSNSAARLGIGLTALAGFAVKSAMDWETAWAGVTKTIEGTPAQLAAIEQGLQDMSSVKPVTAIELAEIAESAGALGVKTKDILSFTAVMADLGQSTNLTSDEAATSIAQLMNVMQTAPADVDNLGAALVDLGNKGASTERQIIQMAQNIAGAGAIVGLSEANVLALGNALASSGIEAEAGGSAISNVLMDIDKAVSTGSEKLGGFAEVAGMSAQDFASKWEAAPADAIATFIEGLGRMNESGEDVFSTLSALGQSDIRVTRALLNMAASGDMLRESLANGDAAWDNNSALALEAAKRYDTTASQVKMSWNDIKAAAVEAGEALLPVVGSMADAVGGLAGAFGRLPDEAQGGLTAIAAVGGAGLLAFAGLTKLAGGLVASSAAMSALQASSPAAAGALGRVSKAVGVAVVALGAYYALNKSQGGGEKIAGTAEITKQFLALADGSDAAKKSIRELATIKADEDILSRLGMGPSGSDIDGIKELFDSAKRNTVQSIGNKITPYDDSYDTAQKGIQQIDAALTQMVSSGAVEQAAAGFRFLGEESGKSINDLKALLPGYAEAVQGVDNQQRMAGDSAETMGGQIDAVASETAAAAEAFKQAQERARETGNAFVDLGDDIDNPKVSLGDWVSQLEAQGKALRDFTKNAKSAAKDGLDEGLIASLQEAGPAGAQRMAELANASDAEIKRANKAWRRGQKAIEDYVNMAVPAKNVDVNIDGAREELRRLQGLINGMNGKTVHVAVKGGGGGITKEGNTGIRVPAGYATGGKVPGTPPANPRVDNIMAYGATTGEPFKIRSGEWIINQRQSEKNDRWLAAINAGLNIDDIITGYASGGRASALDIKNQQRQVRDLEQSLREREPYGKKRKGRKRPTRLVLKPGSLDEQIARLELREAKKELADLKSGRTERAEQAEKAAEEAQKVKDDRYSAATSARDSVASGLSGGFRLADMVKKNPLGIYRPISGSSIAAGAAAYAAKVKVFAGKIEQARRLGIPVTMLQEVAGLGVEEGTVALNALLSASSADIASIQSSYRDIENYANGAGEVIAKALDLVASGQDSAVGYAEGFINGMNGQAAAMAAAVTNAVQGKKSAAPKKGKGAQTEVGRMVIPTPAGSLNTSNPYAFAAAATTPMAPMEFSLVGVEVAIGTDGIGRIIDGKISAAASASEFEGRFAR